MTMKTDSLFLLELFDFPSMFFSLFFLTSVTSQDVITFCFQWIIFLKFIHVYKLYRLILFSLTSKFCQIMHTNVFNNHSHKTITRYQWSHEFLLLISFLWQNLTSRLNINTEAALRRCSSERVFCECPADFGGTAGVGVWFQKSCICSSVGITLLYGCFPVVFASHLGDYCLLVSASV